MIFEKIVGSVKQVSLQQWKEICFPMDLRPTPTVATSAYPRDLATLFHSSSCTFPQPSAVTPELLPTTWRSHTICGSYTTRLLTDGFLSMLLISLRLIRSKRTPLLHQTSLRETKKSDWSPYFLKKNQAKPERYNFSPPLFLRIKTDEVLRETALFQREAQIHS